MIKKFYVQTNKTTELIDITNKIEEIVNESGVDDGVCYVHIPHTTAGVTINENADPDVKRDMMKELNKIIPFEDNYRHFEGNSAAHIKSSLVGDSQTIIIDEGELLLGTWQGLYFCEFDGPRKREVIVKLIRG